jgi:hypothetical protein
VVLGATIPLRDVGELFAACGPFQLRPPTSRSFVVPVIGPSVPELACPRFGAFSKPSDRMEAVGAAPRGSVPLRLRLMRRFSANLARAFALASRLICRSADGGYLGGGGATLKSVMGDLGRLNTIRCESCGQAEHLNVWRSNATSDVGSARGSICIRRILAPQAKHFIQFLPLDSERQGPHCVKRSNHAASTAETRVLERAFSGPQHLRITE